MTFYSSLKRQDMNKYLKKLLRQYFPDNAKLIITNKQLTTIINHAYERIEYCFSNIHDKYYDENGKIYFSHLNADHVCTFLYFLANTGYQFNLNKEFLDKLFYLNKIINSVDIYYKVKLPSIFVLTHPIGTVLGNASYKDYLYVYQNVVVGSSPNNKGINRYPQLGRGNVLYSHVSVIGDTIVGDNVIFGSNSFVINKQIKSNSIVYGHHPKNRIIRLKTRVIDKYFNIY